MAPGRACILRRVRIGWDGRHGSAGGRLGRAARVSVTAAVAITVAALLAGCGSGGGDEAAHGAGTSASASTSQQEESGPGGGQAEHAGDPLYDTPAYHAISAAMAGDGAVVCTATDADSTTTAYIDGDDMRLDVGDGPDSQHFVTDGQNTDFWQDGRQGGRVFIGADAAQGVASMISGLGVNFTMLREQAGEQAGTLDPDASVDCEEYVGDGSVFDTPPGREFTSAQQLKDIVGDEGAPGPGPSGGGAGD